MDDKTRNEIKEILDSVYTAGLNFGLMVLEEVVPSRDKVIPECLDRITELEQERETRLKQFEEYVERSQDDINILRAENERLKKALKEISDEFDFLGREEPAYLRNIAVQALKLGGGEMSEWEIVDNKMLVNSDFKNDAALHLTGDWNNEEEILHFLTDVCNKLNHYSELEQERDSQFVDIQSLKGALQATNEYLKRVNSTLRAEHSALKKWVDYFETRLNERMNQVWELKKKNAMLQKPITPEIIERAMKWAGKNSSSDPEYYKRLSDKLNELREGK